MSEKNNVKNTISQKLLVIVIVPMLLLSAACAIIGYNLIFSALSDHDGNVHRFPHSR